jgi:hypothetical protein
MRFNFGNAPEGQTRTLVKEGWQSIPSLGAKRVQNYGLLVACVNMLIVSLLLHGEIRSSSIWTTLLIVVFATPLHELVHALTTPGWGRSDQTVIGLQRSMGLLLPYMVYDGSQRLLRMLITGLAPLLVLTVLPVSMLLFTPLNGQLRADLAFLAFFNVAISGGDLVNIFWLVTRLPLHATVQNDGWELLWK